MTTIDNKNIIDMGGVNTGNNNNNSSPTLKMTSKKDDKMSWTQLNLRSLSGAAACGAYILIQRTLFGQPLLAKDLAIVMGTCAGKSMVMSWAKNKVKDFYGIIVPSNKNKASSGKKNITLEQIAKDTGEAAIIDGVETAITYFSDKATAKNLAWKKILTLSAAKSYPGHFMDTKTYKDRDNKDADIVTSISAFKPYKNLIERNENTFQKIVDGIGYASLPAWASSGVKRAFGNTQKKQADKYIFHTNAHGENGFGEMMTAKDAIAPTITIKKRIENLIGSDVSKNIFGGVNITKDTVVSHVIPKDMTIEGLLKALAPDITLKDLVRKDVSKSFFGKSGVTKDTVVEHIIPKDMRIEVLVKILYPETSLADLVNKGVNKEAFNQFSLAKDAVPETMTVEDLIKQGVDKNIFAKDDIPINTLVKDAIPQDMTIEQIIAKGAKKEIFNDFYEKTLVNSIVDEKVLAKDFFPQELLQQDMMIKNKLARDVTEYLLLGAVALGTAIPATALNNAPLTGMNFAKTVGLRFISLGLWNGAMDLAAETTKLVEKIEGKPANAS